MSKKDNDGQVFVLDLRGKNKEEFAKELRKQLNRILKITKKKETEDGEDIESPSKMDN